VKIAIGQINSTIGDFEGNRERILNTATQARDAGAELIVFPELSLCGYPPMDLLDHSTFVEENVTALRKTQQSLPHDIAVVLGYVERSYDPAGKTLCNMAVAIRDGVVLFRQAKRLLPTYDVFDEARYFEPAGESLIWHYGGLRLGLAICEDIWWEAESEPGTRYPVDPVRDLLDAGAQIILAPSASPYYVGKRTIRRKLVSSIGRHGGVPVIYVNSVGGNDSLIFDGASMVADATGTIIAECSGFEEDCIVVTVAPPAEGAQAAETPGRGIAAVGAPAAEVPVPSAPAAVTPPGAASLTDSDLEEMEAALLLGIRDYLAKTGFSSVNLGLSGGIDSAVVAVLAVRALGADRVTAFLMPSQYSSSGSVTDAEHLAENLSIRRETLPIRTIYEAFDLALDPHFTGTESGIAEENIQARIRGTLLMAWSNKFGSLTLTTGNKSELAVGYCTLYGDMAGALAVIGDVLKTEVYALARYINRIDEVIPEAIITKAPSAELRPDQKDEDSLPPYPVLDRILMSYLIDNHTYSQIVAEGHDPETVSRVLGLVGRAEYKRRQAPPVLKISARAFGTGRRMPIARRIYEPQR
jgi:NAD+ synthase (glutamine-hydrolysing)